MRSDLETLWCSVRKKSAGTWLKPTLNLLIKLPLCLFLQQLSMAMLCNVRWFSSLNVFNHNSSSMFFTFDISWNFHSLWSYNERKFHLISRMFAIHCFARIKISISINLNVSVITSCSANAVSKCQTHIQAANIVFAEKIDLCFRKIPKEVSNAGDLL